MDIFDYATNFLKIHENSNTKMLLRRLNFLKERSNIKVSEIIRIITENINWDSTIEGYYYYYFLQVRFGLAITLFLYKNEEIEESKMAIDETSNLLEYSANFYDWHASRDKTMKMDKHHYLINRAYIKRMHNMFINMLYSKNIN